MKNEELIKAVQEIVSPYCLEVEIMEQTKSVGVQGDSRTYTPVAYLSGTFPGYDVLEKLSTEISNTCQINRVLFEVAKEQK